MCGSSYSLPGIVRDHSWLRGHGSLLCGGNLFMVLGLYQAWVGHMLVKYLDPLLIFRFILQFTYVLS